MRLCHWFSNTVKSFWAFCLVEKAAKKWCQKTLTPSSLILLSTSQKLKCLSQEDLERGSQQQPSFGRAKLTHSWLNEKSLSSFTIWKWAARRSYFHPSPLGLAKLLSYTRSRSTLGQNDIFCPKNEILKMGFLWIWASEMGFLWIMRLWKCDFCENAILKMWMLLIMWSWTCEFLDRLWIFAPVCEASFWWYGSKDITEVLGLFLARNPPTFVEKYYVDDAAAPRANCECAFYLLRG